MNIVAKSINFLEKLRGLPEFYKKVILWTIVSILAVTMGYFWVKEIGKNISRVNLEYTTNTQSANTPATDILQTTTPSNK